jgi:hypothetical protein
MRKVLIGIVAGLALAAGSAQAAGNPAVDDFKAMCLATAGDPAKAVALAENAGWLPQDISRPGVDFVKVRFIDRPEGRHMLMVVRHSETLPGRPDLKLVMCGVSLPAPSGDPVAAMTTLLGPPNRVENGRAFWLVAAAGERIVALPDSDPTAIETARREHRLGLAQAYVERELAMATLDLPGPATP